MTVRLVSLLNLTFPSTGTLDVLANNISSSETISTAMIISGNGPPPSDTPFVPFTDFTSGFPTTVTVVPTVPGLVTGGNYLVIPVGILSEATNVTLLLVVNN